MQFTVGLLLGHIVGGGLLLLSRRHKEASWPSWTLLGVGAVALVLFAVGMLKLMDYRFAAIPALAVPFAGLVFGIGLVAGGDRRWQAWLGLTLAAVPALFWIVFAIGEIVVPHP